MFFRSIFLHLFLFRQCLVAVTLCLCIIVFVIVRMHVSRYNPSSSPLRLCLFFLVAMDFAYGRHLSLLARVDLHGSLATTMSTLPTTTCSSSLSTLSSQPSLSVFPLSWSALMSELALMNVAQFTRTTSLVWCSLIMRAFQDSHALHSLPLSALCSEVFVESGAHSMSSLPISSATVPSSSLSSE